jgi:hypothetical protein
MLATLIRSSTIITILVHNLLSPSSSDPTFQHLLKIIKISHIINGLVSKDFDKLNDVSFLNCIKNLDIIGLVETHF